MHCRISDYGLIGDSRSAALISKYGGIDWCCLPEFDSPAIFAAILDQSKGGHFTLRPQGNFESTQAYLDDTNVLVTKFKTEEGELRIVDAFAVSDREYQKHHLTCDHEILRTVEGISGRVEMTLWLEPRIFYGSKPAQLENREKLGIQFFYKQNTFIFQSTLPANALNIPEDQNRVMATFVVEAGDRVAFSLSVSGQSPAIIPELEQTGPERIKRTIRYWKNWIGKSTYSGVYENTVKRSALALKLLTHAPSGSIIAAPTTSLPEKIGGVRNWDYRYCWLRDASFTVRAMMEIGLDEEAEAYYNWILDATQLTRPRIKVVYSIYGHSSIPEKELDWLAGYRNSRPVRIGNGADDQFQLDVYGEVLDGIYTFSQNVEKLNKDTKKFILGLGKSICKHWNQPDNGIWEIRTKPVHHTHSNAMAHAGLERILTMAKNFDWKDGILKKFEDVAQKIKKKIEKEGFNQNMGSYTRAFGGDQLDASLLVLPLVGYIDADSDRMMGTIDAIQKTLTKNDFVYRYEGVDDGLPANENSFAICTCWLIENLAMSGRLAEAKRLFEKMEDCAAGTGLLAEEIEPTTGELIGNFPQAFTHIGMINAALTIDKELKKQKK